MSDLCNYLEEKLVDHVLRNTSYTPPATVYVALLSADPGEAGSTTDEISGASYERQSAAFDAPTDGVTQNTSDIEFPQAVEDWGEITHILLMNADTGGNPLFHQILKSAVEDESFTSDHDVSVALDHENIVEDSEVVTSSDGSTTYYKGRDYTMDYTNGTITVLSTGLMADATSYLIDYEYENPKTITTNDIFKIPAGSLEVSFQ
jgi:hypothetical protein